MTNANLFMDRVFFSEIPKAVGAAGLEAVPSPPLTVFEKTSNRSIGPSSTWNFSQIVSSELSTGIARSVV